MINESHIHALMPLASTINVTKFVKAFNDNAKKYGVDSYNRVCMFLANAAHESGELQFMRELWGTQHQLLYERDFSQPFEAGMSVSARNYLAYSLGNSQIGDGKTYLGRGIFQTTGRANYEAISKAIGVDFVQYPQLLQEMNYAVESAFVFWNENKLSTYADANDLDGVSDIINMGHKTRAIGDAIGFAKRKEYFDKAQIILKSVYGIAA